MIICPNCGSACEDNSNFCVSCGYRFDKARQANVNGGYYAQGYPQGNQQGYPQGYSQGYPQGNDRSFVPGQLSGREPKKKRSKAFFIIPLLAVIVLAVVIAVNVMVRSSKVIELEKCVSVAFTGYNGEGTAILTINTRELEEQIKAAKGKDADQYDAESMADYIKLNGTVKKHADSDNTDGVVENDLDHLSRGDVITVTIDYSELQKRYKELEFSGKDKDVEVNEGLKDYKEIDPFGHVVPEFSGTAPFGEAGIKSITDKIPPELIDFDSIRWYEINKTNRIDIGDTIVLKFTEEGKHSWKEKGLKPARDEMTYTVTENDLPKFVTKMEEISEEDMAKMQAEARDRVVSYLVDHYNQPNTEYVGAYLLVPKKENWDYYSRKSFLYLVFKSQIKYQDESVSDIYLVVRSSDIRKLKQSEEASDLYDDSEDNKVFTITEFSGVNEYSSLDDLYNDLILKKSEYERDPEFAGPQ